MSTREELEAERLLLAGEADGVQVAARREAEKVDRVEVSPFRNGMSRDRALDRRKSEGSAS